MTVLMTALKNRVNKQAAYYGSTYKFNLKNISINGDKRGCSGFITNPDNGAIVYVTTEDAVYSPLSGKAMYRLARNTKDYGGLRNRWADLDEDRYISEMVNLLENPEKDSEYIREVVGQ